MLKLKENVVRKMIAKTGYSVAAWAEKNGFSQGSLSNWITGTRNIKHSNLDKLAAALGCEPNEIVNIVIDYTGEGVSELEADREEICGIFGNLNEEQRKAIIAVAVQIDEANRRAERIEIGLE